jgi:LPS-assembly lipoprotein
VIPRLLLVAVLLALLSACGWQLRGATMGSLEGRAVMLRMEANLPEIERDLRRGLQGLNAELVETAEAADAVLIVMGEESRRRALAVDRDAQVQEYEIEYGVRIRLEDAEGESLAEPELISRSRGYRYEAADLLATQAREESVREEMRRDVVRVVLMRAQALVGAGR